MTRLSVVTRTGSAWNLTPKTSFICFHIKSRWSSNLVELFQFGLSTNENSSSNVRCIVCFVRDCRRITKIKTLRQQLLVKSQNNILLWGWLGCYVPDFSSATIIPSHTNHLSIHLICQTSFLLRKVQSTATTKLPSFRRENPGNVKAKQLIG